MPRCAKFHTTAKTIVGLVLIVAPLVRVSGAVENQYVDMSGSGAYLANGLTSQTSQVNVWGGGQVELWVEKLLDVNVFGNAQVSYGGTPRVLQNLYGTGAIRPVK